MRPTGAVAVVFLRALLDSGARAGVDAERAMADVGVSRSVLDDLNGWLPVDAMTRAWELVPRLSRDPEFGIHAAESTPTGVYGVLEFATISSPTGAAALERVERYYRLMGAMSEIAFLRDGALGTVTMRPIVAPTTDLRQYCEHFFALLVTRLALLTASSARPRFVAFTHARPDDTREHARVFGADVRFGQTRAEVAFDAETLATPLRTANPELAKVLADAERALELPDGSRVEARVRRVLPGALSGGDASLAALAKRLGLSTRTLQRKLSEEGVSYTNLVEETRRAAALDYVREGRMSLGEIAFVLGFSQASAFHRAFKRWTGATPGDYRATGAAARRER